MAVDTPWPHRPRGMEDPEADMIKAVVRRPARTASSFLPPPTIVSVACTLSVSSLAVIVSMSQGKSSSPPPPNGPPASASSAATRVGKSRRFSFYAVVGGEQIGVFSEWLVAAPLVTGWPGAQFCGFHTLDKAASAYHTAIAAHPNPPPEHPASLVFHFADRAATAGDVEAAAAGEDEATDDPVDAPSHAAAHGHASHAHATAAAPPPPPPAPSAQPAPPPPSPVVAATIPVVAAPTSVVTTSALPAASSSSAHQKSKAPFRPPSQEELDALSDVMQSLELDELLQYLIGRRNPPLHDEPSEEQPVVMTVALNRDPESGEVAPGYRVVTRTYAPPDVRDDAPPDVRDDDIFSTAPPSPSSTGSIISLTSTPSASPSLSSLTMTSAGSGDTANQRVTAELNMPINAGSSAACPCPSIPLNVAVTTSVHEERSEMPLGAPRTDLNGGEASTSRSTERRASMALLAALMSCFSGALLRAQIGIDDGDEWYAVVRGHVTGIFRGPLQNVRAFVVNFPNAFFCGFRTRDAALAWFVDHEHDKAA
ncbi:hypothetical protein FA95DRAFT_1612323 [Auriscalpium vulgare]|uniref:Uncharacterized protein n=1 Tax=Auriscalpium vulgare TaxID=40419 RepID=A0ACB8R6M1_9AGAM|nr:hypothetical protein FA95DRAFT_1612323 [Auriscalpium vulgare]